MKMHFFLGLTPLLWLMGHAISLNLDFGSLKLLEFNDCSLQQSYAILGGFYDATLVAAGARDRLQRLAQDNALHTDPTVLEFLGPYPAHNGCVWGLRSAYFATDYLRSNY